MTRLGDFSTLGNFSKPVVTVSLPKSSTFQAIFVQVSKSFIFLVELFLGNFLLVTLVRTQVSFLVM